MLLQQSLAKEQKEAVKLLSIGTFLEYFDLMLYVHMAVLLNDLFFPKHDSSTTPLLSSFAFCSIFLLRPIGALIFGWVGDTIGRKKTVIITTMMMAFSCITMAVLPTYAQIGITASWLMTLCRMAQSISSMEEIIGAEIYLTETIKSRAKYPAVALLSLFSVLGGFAALAVASFVMASNLNWRIAFWVGAVIAVVGFAARTRLRETPDFVDAKRKLEKIVKNANLDKKNLNKSAIWNEKVNTKTSLAYFLMQCVSPIYFYLAYIHSGNILKNSFGFTAAEVVNQNLIVSISQVFALAGLTYLSGKIYPLTILKIKTVIFSIFILLCPYILNNINSSFGLLFFQMFVVAFTSANVPAVPILYSYFPIFKRYTYTTVVYAMARALIYLLTSFGLIYFTDYFGNYGLWIIMMPPTIGFIFGINHFEELEKIKSAWKVESEIS
jgi:MHS family proline/betaine transporter-like MFS transporter